MNVSAQRIHHPPRISRHFSATGASMPNMRSLKTRKRIPSTIEVMRTMMARIFWRRVSFWKTLTILRWTLSALRRI